MKRKLSLFFVSTLLLSTATTIVACNKDPLVEDNNGNNNGHTIDETTAIKYANLSSIVPKALLLGADKGFNTNSLITNIYNKYSKSDTKLFSNLTPSGDSGNDFLASWTTDLDRDSTNLVQELFQRTGENQAVIDKHTKNITDYESYLSIADTIKGGVTNETLANPNVAPLVTEVLTKVKDESPYIVKYLSYGKLLPATNTVLEELTQSWAKESDFTGNTTFDRMYNYMETNKHGDISQAWTHREKYADPWHYIKARANIKKWTWDNFYEYMAGVNFNYLFKELTGKYLGQIFTDNVTYVAGGLSPNGFNDQNVMNEISAAMKKLLETPDALPYLIKALIPVIKTQMMKDGILHLTSATEGVRDIVWDNSDNKHSLGVKQAIEYVEQLMTNKDKLVALITSLLRGPFAEDIIVGAKIFWTWSFYTIPEAQESLSWIVSALAKLPVTLGDQLMAVFNKLHVQDEIKKIFAFTDKYLVTNPVIDLQQLQQLIAKTIGSTDFKTVIDKLLTIVNSPDNPNVAQIKEVMSLLGVQYNNEQEFRKDSILATISGDLNDDKSLLSQIIRVFITSDDDQSGMLNQMLKKEQDAYYNEYEKYFDLNNEQYPLTNIKMVPLVNDDGSVSAKLTYIITFNDTSYEVAFINSNFFTSSEFRLSLLHRVAS